MGEPYYNEFEPSYDPAVYYYDENGYIIDDSDDTQRIWRVNCSDFLTV